MVASTRSAHDEEVEEEEKLLVTVKWSSRQREGRIRGSHCCRHRLQPRDSAPPSGLPATGASFSSGQRRRKKRKEKGEKKGKGNFYHVIFHVTCHVNKNT